VTHSREWVSVPCVNPRPPGLANPRREPVGRLDCPRMDTSSRDLVESTQRGDRAALEELLIRQLPALQAFLRLRMGPELRAKESCSDLVQSVCREVLRGLSGFEYRDEAGFRAWLFTHARHKVLHKQRNLHAQRRDAARELPLSRGSEDNALLDCYRTLCTPSRVLAADEALAHIEAAFDALPEDYKEAIVLHRLVGLSHAEIAAKLDRSEGAVRNLVYRGLSQLALQLNEDSPAD